MPWTLFSDLESGGYTKAQHRFIAIRLPRDEALEYFATRYRVDPFHVTCPGCGVDYNVTEYPSFDAIPEGVLRRGVHIDACEGVLRAPGSSTEIPVAVTHYKGTP